jgi:hypothetical protein
MGWPGIAYVHEISLVSDQECNPILSDMGLQRTTIAAQYVLDGSRVVAFSNSPRIGFVESLKLKVFAVLPHVSACYDGGPEAIMRAADMPLRLVEDADTQSGLSGVDAAKSFGDTQTLESLIRDLSSESLDVRVLAINKLSMHPTFRRLVRNKIFFDTGASSETRAAAASALGQSDPSFSTYALVVALEPELPDLVLAATVRGFIVQRKERGTLDGTVSAALRRTIEARRSKVTNPEAAKIFEETLTFIGR